ncbi:DNA mismatch repair protein [Blastomyces dermatitidis ATCC 18188]|uniref:DNA mismatch repair protein n=1 Tax=Ajellomyces dermatitidis (strain ATCC 18188 / CBS 674.68) TaxID=653446 RepID=F2TB73_AJEDA|nr:DNA mismatch repair protein [Blastomyces dermatitidis ATCC 18188]
MDERIQSIRPLPSGVVAKLKSSIAISNLNGVVLELLKNSLDARAQTVSINVNFQRGGCAVEDDGQGILPAEFMEGGNLAKLHHTSGFNSPHQVYGRKGAFLASLVSLALVTITSHHESASTTNTVVYHHAKSISRLTPAPLQHELDSRDHGTRVTVTDLFGNFPVRVKHRALSLRTSQDLDREWGDLKRMLTAILLAFQKPVKLVVSDATKTRQLVFRASRSQYDKSSGPLDLGRIRRILMHAGYVMPGDFQSWVTASALMSGIEIQSAISLQPAPTKEVQFISFGINPIFSQSNMNVLYKEVNRLFSHSRFGVIDDPPVITDGLGGLNLQGDDKTNDPKASSGREKSINRWPMFYIRIGLQECDDAIDKTDDLAERNNSLQSVLDVLVAMIRQFLEEYHFRPRSGTGTKRSRQPQSPTSPVERQVVKRPKSAAPAFLSPLASTGIHKGSGNTEELFNTCIRLPRAAHALNPAHPKNKAFGSWSRIKSSRDSGFDEIWSGLPRGKSPFISNASTKNQVEHDRSCSYSSSPTPDQSGELSDSHDVRHFAKPSSPDDTGDLGLQGVEKEHNDGSPDEAIRWVDPITRTAISINSRTGQTILNQGRPFTSSQDGIQKPGSFDRHSCSGNLVSHPNLWIDTFLKEWNNPIFQQSEQPVTTAFQVLGLHSGSSRKHFLSGTGDFGFMPSSSRFTSRLTKQGLQNAQLIAQVDNKFLLLKLPASSEETNADRQQNLVLVDQHAADERCRIEQLFVELCGTAATTSDPSSFCQNRGNTSSLPKPISFQVSPQEGELLKSHSDYFEFWGCYYTLSPSERDYHTVTIDKVPTLIAERCRVEPKLAIDLLRNEIWERKDHGRKDRKLPPRTLCSGIPEAGNSEKSPNDEVQPTIARHSWLELISDCPKTIIDLLISRACRSSIMFNDCLSRVECENLISRLAVCAFPFQCAHGRPSMIPIVNLGSISSSDERCTNEALSAFDFISRFGNNSGNAPAINLDLPFMEAFKRWNPDAT